jgi:hypothetical protein
VGGAYRFKTHSIHRSDFRLWKSLSENTGVTTFQAAAFQNAQGLASATIRSGESLPECAYETKNARVSVRTVLVAVVIASELKSGNPRSQGLELRSVKLIHQLWAAERRFRSVNNLEAHLAGGAGDDAKSGFVVACI